MKQLTNRRLETFTNEPLKDGNRHVTLPDQTSDTAVATKIAKDNMHKHLQSILSTLDKSQTMKYGY
jgi:hypothetical protein